MAGQELSPPFQPNLIPAGFYTRLVVPVLFLSFAEFFSLSLFTQSPADINQYL